MRRLMFRARLLISAWFALILLWPLQAAALGVGHRMTLACRMMPALHVAGHMSLGSGRGMGACHELQCHHRLGPRAVTAHSAPSAMPSFVILSFSPVFTRGCPFAPASGIRGPPLYLRLSRLLI